MSREASVISGPGKDQLEIHLGAGSTHEYDPHYPDRYNVTTFGESDIPVDISASASLPQSRQLTDAERTVPDLLGDHGPGWRAARVELNNRFALPAACLVFALLGVPIGVRPRRGGRAAGMILTLVLIGGYYFFVDRRRPLRAARRYFAVGRDMDGQHRLPSRGLVLLQVGWNRSGSKIAAMAWLGCIVRATPSETDAGNGKRGRNPNRYRQLYRLTVRTFVLLPTAAQEMPKPGRLRARNARPA